MDLDVTLQAELAAWQAQHLQRTLRVVEPNNMQNFAANDYLGFRQHPQLIAAASAAVGQHGVGAGASRLISGTTSDVMALEEELAAWKETAAALVFGSGYAAALGAIPALVRRGDVVVLDKLAHACLIDGARLSGATLRVFPHNHLARLEKILQNVAAKKTSRVLILTESIFSMDGDAALLPDLVALKEKYGAWLLVDEAHATGLYGESGAGLIQACGLSQRVEIIMGTLSKALGGLGGYIAGSRSLINFLVHRARSFIYSTALPPGVIAANRAAVALAQGTIGDERRRRLWRNVAHFLDGLPDGLSDPHSDAKSLVRPDQRAIQPLICGEAAAALKLAQALEMENYYVPAIRYPTVPRGSARLRVALNASHTPEQINGLLQALAHQTMNSRPIAG